MRRAQAALRMAWRPAGVYALLLIPIREFTPHTLLPIIWVHGDEPRSHKNGSLTNNSDR